MRSDSNTKLRQAQILAAQKKKVREAVKQGKRPFYIKKCNSFHLLLSVFSFSSLYSSLPFRETGPPMMLDMAIHTARMHTHMQLDTP